MLLLIDVQANSAITTQSHGGKQLLVIFSMVVAIIDEAFESVPLWKLGKSLELKSQLSSESWRAFWGLRARPAARSIEERCPFLLSIGSLTLLQTGQKHHWVQFTAWDGSGTSARR